MLHVVNMLRVYNENIKGRADGRQTRRFPGILTSGDVTSNSPVHILPSSGHLKQVHTRETFLAQ